MDYAKIINEKKEERQKALVAGREKVELAEKEKRSMTPEEEGFYQKSMDEFDRIDKEIERLEGLRERDIENKEKRSGKFDTENPAHKQGETEEKRKDEYLNSQEYREKFFDVLTGKRSARDVANEVRASTGLNVSIDTDKGATLAPPVFSKSIIDIFTSKVTMRGIASIMQTNSTTNIPFLDQEPTGYWTGEEAAYTKSEMKWSTKEIKAHKETALILVSEELMADSYLTLEPYIRAKFAKVFADMEEKAFFFGDGTNKPKGVALDATAGVTTASTIAINPDELIDMFYALDEQYEANSNWVMSRDLARMLRKAKYSTGEYVWQSGLQAGTPNTILERPVKTSDAMEKFEAGKIPLLFGDFSFYKIGDREGMFFQRLVEKYSDYGQIGLRAYKRTDGKLLVPEAVLKLTVKSV